MIEINVSDREMIFMQMAKKGFNLTSLSQVINISQPYLSLVLSGKRPPSPKLAKSIAEELGLNVNSVFDFKVTTELIT